MKKIYIKPAVEIFRFDHTETLLANSPNFDLDEEKPEIDDEGDVWSNKRDWSNTDSKSFWK